MNIHNAYCEYFKPLVSSFVEELRKSGQAERYAGIPELFLPAWGKHYEDSLLKIAFIGRDTYGWGSGIPHTIEMVMKNEWDGIFDLSEFQELCYLGWRCDRRYTFWGFVLFFLAWLYGIDNWEVLKWGEHKDILSSFAWGNTNSIERWDSKTFRDVRKKMTQEEYQAFGHAYEVVKIASRAFDGYSHFEKLLAPDVVFITCERGDCDRYLSKSNPGEPIFCDDSADLRVYKIGNAIVVNIPHPQGIMYRSDNHKADYYARELRSVLEKNGKFLPMKNEFLADDKMAAEFLSVFARQLDPKRLSTRDAVEQIAMELRKQDACMTVPFLCDVLNKAGFRTDWGNEYLAGRGSYRMLSWFYRHYETEKPDVAKAIAEAFKKPDGTYAYE